MMDLDAFPPVPDVLVQALERLFPDRCPEIDTPDRHVWHYAGQVAVVRYLRHQYEEQQQRGVTDPREASTDLGLFTLSPLDKEW